MTKQQIIQFLLETIDDYGMQISAEKREEIGAFLEAAKNRADLADLMAEQASYALRYRHGEDIEQCQRSLRHIVTLNA